MPLASRSLASISAIQPVPSRRTTRYWSRVGSKPVRMILPSVRTIGASGSIAASMRRQSSGSSSNWAMRRSSTGSPISTKSDLIKGTWRRVSPNCKRSLGVVLPKETRLAKRSISYTPLRRSARSLRSKKWSKKTWIISWRSSIRWRSIKGFWIQVRKRRPPMAVLLSSRSQ